ncbi:MAG: O-antigen ligase family protein [bacterium]|nr:O-antigen ligase family protein [bacterium]
MRAEESIASPGKVKVVERGRIILRLLVVAILVLSPLWWGLFFPLARLTAQAAIWLLASAWLAVSSCQPVTRPAGGWSTILVATLTAFACSYALALPGAVLPGQALARFLESLSYLAFVFLVLETAGGQSGREIYLGAIVLAALVATAVGALSLCGVIEVTDAAMGARLAATFQYPNTLAALLLVALMAGWALLTRSPSLIFRLAGIVLANLLFLAFVLTYSRAAYLALGPAVAVTWAFQPRGLKARALALGAAFAFPPLLAIRGISANLAIANLVSAGRWLGLSLALSVASVLALAVATAAFQGAARRLGPARMALAGGLALLILSAGTVGVLRALPALGENLALTAGRLSPAPLLHRLDETTLETSSAAQRFQYFADAARMIARRPLRGWGGGGWAALYGTDQPYLYVASEVHNHFLQVGVEAGVPGLLAFTGLWAFFFAALAAGYRRSDSRDRSLIAGLAGAGTGFMLHSALDFNLSFMAMFLVACTLWGIGVTWAGGGDFPGAAGRALDRLSGRVARWRALRLPAGMLLLLVTAVLLAGHLQLNSAERAWARGEFKPAEARFRLACRLDPLNADAASSQLFFYSTLYNHEPGEELALKTLAAASRLRRLDPFGPVHNGQVTQVYLDLERWEDAVVQARHTVRTQPYKGDHYERLAKALAMLLVRSLAEGDLAQARSLAGELAGIPEVVLELRAGAMPMAALTGNAHRQLDLTPRLALEAAKGRYFRRDWAGAEAMLELAYSSLALTVEADRWFYLLYEAMLEAGVPGADSKLEPVRGMPWSRFIHLQPEYLLVRSLPLVE